VPPQSQAVLSPFGNKPNALGCKLASELAAIQVMDLASDKTQQFPSTLRL